jgi:hypothetical protein
MDHDIESTAIADNAVDRRYDGAIGLHVEFNGAQIDIVLGCIPPGILDLQGIAAFRSAHACVDNVAATSECAGGERAETTRCARDDDDLFHDLVPLMSADR